MHAGACVLHVRKSKLALCTALQFTEVRFASFLYGGFTIMAVINQPERKLTKRISVQLLVAGTPLMMRFWGERRKRITD